MTKRSDTHSLQGYSFLHSPVFVESNTLQYDVSAILYVHFERL